MKLIAARASLYWAGGTFGTKKRPFLAFFAALAVFGALGGCSALPDKPARAALYDFGLAMPSAVAPVASVTATSAIASANKPPLAIEDISTPGGALDNMSVLYRLGYADVQQLRPYALARWSMPPAQLLRQRLKERIGQSRPVFNAGEGVAIERSGRVVTASAGSTTAVAANPLLLRVELEEFSQLFDTPTSSTGVMRLRATLVAITPGGEKLLGQRLFAVQQPAPTLDAAGGVRALTTASDAAIEALVLWLDAAQQQLQPPSAVR